MASLNKYEALGALPKDWAVTAVQFTRNVYTTVYPAIDPANPENSLKGKTVVVTGASQGIGAEGIAPSFVRAGVKAIVLIARNAAKLASVEKQLRAINPEVEVLSLAVDIISSDRVNEAWSEIHAKYKKVDILINNAGIEATDSDKTHELDPDMFFRNFVSDHPQTPYQPQRDAQYSLSVSLVVSSSYTNIIPSNAGSQCQRHPHDDSAVSQGCGLVGHDHQSGNYNKHVQRERLGSLA